MNTIMNYVTEIIESEDTLLMQEKAQITNKLRDKVRLIRLLKEGNSLQQATKFIQVSYRQAQRYVTIYRTQGLQELLKVHYKSNAAKLSSSDIEAIRRYIKKFSKKEENVKLTLSHLQQYIQTEFNQEYTLGGISSLLKRHKIFY
jgi:transposase